MKNKKQIVTLDVFNEELLKRGFKETCLNYRVEGSLWKDYLLSEDTLRELCTHVTRVVKANDGTYIFCGHLSDNSNIYKHFPYICYRLKLNFSLVDRLNAYAYSDEQRLLVMYCESDISFIPYTDNEKYLLDKQNLWE